MRIVHCALTRLQVGDDIREAGDLVPEASDWAFLPTYVREGKLMPVLVATLPEEQQQMLLDWEDAQRAPQAEAPVEEPKRRGRPPKTAEDQTNTPDGEKGKVA